MWDDAVLQSAHSGKPTLAFDLDLVDSNSIVLAEEVMGSKRLQKFILDKFEPAMNDFATDPPPSVGLDSLRNLGWRLSGLEKDYDIAIRPSMIVLGPDKKEMDRITLPEKLSADEIEARLSEILEGRNTLQSTIDAFWRDTTSIVVRQHLINMFEERAKYDSVLYHVEVLSHNSSAPTVARGSALRYAYLRLQVEGATQPMERLIDNLGTGSADSLLHYTLLDRLREHFEKIKKHDSVNTMIERMIDFTHYRDPDLLNDEAWNIASFGKGYDSASRLINEAIAKKGNDPDYYDTRALVSARQQKMAEAIRDEETAITYADKNSQDYFEGQLKTYKELKEKMEAEAKKSSSQ